MLIAKGNEEFTKFPLPDTGTVQAVCCGVWDLGMQKSSFNGEDKILHKIVVAWEINQMIDSPESEFHGKPYMLSNKYTLSLGDKANLRRDLESWRGKPFTAEEITSGFNVEQLYGINCLIGINHVTKGEKTYANVSSILPLVKGMEKITPLRTKDEAPPKWVVELQAQAIRNPDEDNQENPFGDEPA